ncbi:MAG: hypothetical protein MK085_13020, partial [Phycisphaerales bacterium]|nr:hypothetical protein [Phycisphaerales bacterium]
AVWDSLAALSGETQGRIKAAKKMQKTQAAPQKQSRNNQNFSKKIKAYLRVLPPRAFQLLRKLKANFQS